MTGVLESLSKVEECSVCGDVADGYHYGVLSCRGCNAFFRRAITHNMCFSCRRGGNCLVDKNARCACRACRLKKCEQVGMDRRAVQPKRQDVSPPRKTISECSAGSGFSDSIKSSEETSPLNYAIVSPSSTSVNFGEKDTYLKTSPSTSAEVTPSSVGLIAMLTEDYKEQRKRRRNLLCNTIEEILCDDFDVRLKSPATSADYVAIFKVQMVLMFEWANKLNEFRSISSAVDRAKLLRAFALRYMLLDNVFHTVECGLHDKFVLINNTFITPGVIPPFVPIEGDSGVSNLLMYGENSVRLIEELTSPMIEMHLTIGEMMALRLIIFWNPGSIGLSVETSAIVQAASDRAVRELHRWYDEENVEEIDTRLGNVLLLLPSLAKHTQHLYDTVKMIPSFGVMEEWDSSMNEIFNQ
ncbi:hypothetical protein AB6A40_008914 [Gnathostoma spinigerum]|uniref:Uncharacterized protein n=1 Tax=Gnathostoma spinigerum TaxID=75299 RepID=A0ABD6EQF8_9BILA